MTATTTTGLGTTGLVEALHDLADHVGDDALEAARLLVQDFLGVAVAGSRTPEGTSVTSWARTSGRSGTCHVVGAGNLALDPAAAALGTGTSGYSIGLTDTHARSITHPGPSVVPAALAVAEQTGASGRDLLAAVVTGCEAVVRVGSVVNPSHRARGFHPTATCNVFGSAVAASQLLHLDAGRTLDALGLACSMAGGLYEFRHEGSMLMALHAGWPAQNGIVAAQLAAAGFTGPHTVLEGGEGFFRAFADDVSLEQLTVSPDRPGVLEVGLRPYNACRYGHAGIDALSSLQMQHGRFDPARVRRLTVATHATAVRQESEPSTVVGARLSTAFTVAYALVHGPKIDEVDAADLADPVVTSLLAKTQVVEDPELTAAFPEKWACRVLVELEDGSSYEDQVDVPKGEPANPMTPDEVATKFHGLVDPVLGTAAAGVLEQRLLDLIDAPAVGPLAAALAG